MGDKRTKVCDRCGKEVIYRGWTAILKGKRFEKLGIVQMLNGNCDGYHYFEGEYDLCSECSKSFEHWLSNEEVE